MALPIAALVLVILGAPTLRANEMNAAVVTDVVQQQTNVVHHPHSARFSILGEAGLDEISTRLLHEERLLQRQRATGGPSTKPRASKPQNDGVDIPGLLGASGGTTSTSCLHGTPDQVKCLSAVLDKVPPGEQQGRTALISGHSGVSVKA